MGKPSLWAFVTLIVTIPCAVNGEDLVAGRVAPVPPPLTRTVTVTLAVTPPRDVNFRLKRGGRILADAPAEQLELLQYEVNLRGPAGDFVVHLPVAARSRTREIYQQFGAEQPERVVAELARLGRPQVTVVAVRRGHTTEHFRGNGQNYASEFEIWLPYYRITLADRSIPPRLIPVPRRDEQLYRLAKRRVNLRTHEVNQLTVLEISQAEIKQSFAARTASPEANVPPPASPADDLPFPEPAQTDEA